MKESRTVLILAAMYITALVGATIIDISEYGYYDIGSGWGQRFILGALCWYIVFTSKVKHKKVGIVLGVLLYISMCAILATLSVFGLVHIGG